MRHQNILLISPEPWNHIFVSKHHYATHLAALGNKVHFLNPPGRTKRIEDTNYSNVYSIQYHGFPRGLRFFPGFIQRNYIRKVYAELEKLCEVNFDIIWSFDNSVFYNFSALPKEILKISHIVDLNQDFQTKKAASTADICFCTSDFIQKKMFQFNSKVFKINHGYNIPDNSLPKKLKGSIKVGYVGSLHIPYLDWGVTLKIVEQNPEVDFYFIGPLKTAKLDSIILNIIKRLKDKDHVHFIGLISAFDIPNYLAAMDILLIIYKAEEFREQLASPHKMMDYLGSGKIIVSSYTDEYADKNHLLLMANKNKELPSLFQQAVLNIRELNNNVNRAKRILFAYDNTYGKQVEKIERLITEHIAL